MNDPHSEQGPSDESPEGSGTWSNPNAPPPGFDKWHQDAAGRLPVANSDLIPSKIRVEPLSPDRGTPTSRVLAWVVTIVLAATVLGLNQLGARPEATHEATPSAEILPPDMADPARMQSKIVVMLCDSFAVAMDSAVRHQLFTGVDQAAISNEDKFRAALVAPAVFGTEGPEKVKEETLTRLASLDKAIAAEMAKTDSTEPEGQARQSRDAQLLKDIEAVRAVLNGSDLSKEDAAGLESRHGWSARAFAVRDAPAGSDERDAVTGGGGLLVALFAAIAGIAFLALVLGMVFGVIALTKVARGGLPRAFRPSSPGGSVFLEVVPVFAAGFLLLIVLSPLAVAGLKGIGLVAADSDGLTFKLLAQWLLLPAIFWPVLRGVPFSEWRRRIGWTRGRGVWREIGAGIFGYLAGFPVLVAAMILTVIVFFAWNALRAAAAGGHAPAPPPNPVAELVAGSGGWQLALLYILATVWAPLVEESVFRGAMQRHLRSRMVLLLAAPITAAFFGIMHNYPALLLMPVMTIGMILSVVREWRDSLIGPMVAHSLHNATVLGFAIALFSLLR